MVYIYKRSAFTMVELVFVIVVLGILAAIAVPRMAATRDDAQVTKGISDISAIRSAIVSERQVRMLKGESGYITKLHSANDKLFDGNGSSKLLQYPIAPENANGHWHSPGCAGTTCTYKYKIMNVDTEFTYDQTDGTFTCQSGTGKCDDLMK